MAFLFVYHYLQMFATSISRHHPSLRFIFSEPGFYSLESTQEELEIVIIYKRRRTGPLS